MCLEGKNVLLHEIVPEYFPYVIRWRNDKELNKYLNQPSELTPELERQWYEERYLVDNTQGFMIMIDKGTQTPFGTLGWTDYDPIKRQCITGRLLLSDRSYATRLMEGNFLLMDYLYQFIDVMYAHVGKDNKNSLSWNYRMGFQIQTGEWQYPDEALVNGIEQYEIYRDAATYLRIKSEFMTRYARVLS